MDSFNKTNLQNIKDIFEEKTGVALETRRRRQPIRAAMLVAAVLVCSLTMTAFAVSLFSSLSGDDLSLSATYEGNGIVTIQVANKSDKDLSFQRQLKLMRWSTGKEVEPVSDTIVFDGTEFEAHTNGVMTVDLSKAYDMDFLEQPLADDNYYFVLTNNNFMFGQDWMCFVTFAEPIKTVVDDPIPVTPVEADKELVAQIMEELQPYFENYYTDIADRRNHADNYLVKCQELLATLDRDIVASEASPLAIDGLNPDVVFDKTAPLETQHWLTGLHEHTLDGYGIPVGSAEGESALVLSAYVPQHKGEVDGGAEVPLLYFFTYSVDDIQSPEDYAFIHGQIITFEQLEQYKVYEDDQVFALRDIHPQAPTHILVIPKTHISGCNGVTEENSAVVAHIFEVIPQIAAAEGLTGGYRVVSNCGADAGQTVPHLHFHILGGKALALDMA